MRRRGDGFLLLLVLFFCLLFYRLFYILFIDIDFIISLFCTVLNWFVFGIIMCLFILERILWNIFRYVVEVIVI